MIDPISDIDQSIPSIGDKRHKAVHKACGACRMLKGGALVQTKPDYLMNLSSLT